MKKNVHSSLFDIFKLYRKTVQLLQANIACFIDPFSILVTQFPLINIHASLPNQSACLQIRHFGCVYLCAQNNSAGMYWAASPIAYHYTQATSILTKKMTSGGLTDNLLFKSQCNLMDLRTEDKYSISFARKKHSWHPWLHVNNRVARLVTVSSIAWETQL